MSRQFRIASALSIAASFLTILLSTGGSGAKAQDIQIRITEAPGSSDTTVEAQQGVVRSTEQPNIQIEPTAPDSNAVAAAESEGTRAASLAEMVNATAMPASLSRELECLAGAVYFEARSETLAGQLAVGRVIVARAASGRFPASYCGVVYQHSQFSFVRANTMPPVQRASRLWQQAVKIALIADNGAWKSPVEGAMFFHAARVSPSWGKVRMARIDNHVFYR